MNNQDFKVYKSNLTFLAKPMTYSEYCGLRNWESAFAFYAEELEGYLVEDLNGIVSNHPDFKGYITWVPKSVFEKQYCEVL